MRIWDGDSSDPGWKKVRSGINIPDPQHCKNYCTFHLQNGHYALNSTLHPKNCHSRIWLWDLGSEIVGPRSGIPNPWVNKEPDLESATLFVKNNFLKLTGQRRASSPSLRGTPCTGLSAQPQLPRSLGYKKNVKLRLWYWTSHFPQCGGSGMFIPDPRVKNEDPDPAFFLIADPDSGIRIPESGFRIPESGSRIRIQGLMT